jgi:hypothetical protein
MIMEKKIVTLLFPLSKIYFPKGVVESRLKR